MRVRRARSRSDRGQATVELALVLPLVVVVVLFVVQVALVGLAQVLVVHAARSAARTAAVDPDDAAVVARARDTPGLDADRISVEVGTRGPPGGTVEVTVTYRAPTDMPLAGRLLGDVTLTATVVMPVEDAASTEGGAAPAAPSAGSVDRRAGQPVGRAVGPPPGGSSMPSRAAASARRARVRSGSPARPRRSIPSSPAS